MVVLWTLSTSQIIKGIILDTADTSLVLLKIQNKPYKSQSSNALLHLGLKQNSFNKRKGARVCYRITIPEQVNQVTNDLEIIQLAT